MRLQSDLTESIALRSVVRSEAMMAVKRTLKRLGKIAATILTLGLILGLRDLLGDRRKKGTFPPGR